jgi:hypothetical protein
MEWTPDVKVCLLNPRQLFKDRYNVILVKDGATVTDPNWHTILRVRECGNVYPFELLTLVSLPARQNYAMVSEDKLKARLNEQPMAMQVRLAADLMH